jgi:replicative DNA helicase
MTNPVAADEILRRVPPRDDALEFEVLGFCLSAKDPLMRLHDAELVPDDFAFPLHRAAFALLLDQFQQGKHRADTVALSKALSKDQDFIDRGGKDFWTLVRSHYQGERQAVQAAHHVKDLSRRRALIEGLSSSIFGAYDPAVKLQDALSAAYEALSSTTSNTEARRLVSQKEVIDGVMEDIASLMEGDRGTMGIPTGFPGLDMRTSGFVAGEYYVLAGRPGTGKTAIALNFASHLAWNGSPVMFFSLEMPREQIIKRLLSYTLGIDSNRFRGIGQWTKEEKDRIYSDRMGQVYNMPLHYYDFSRIQAHELRTLMHIGKERMGVKFVVIDYIGLVKPDAKSKDRQREVSDISEAIREAAKDLKLPVLALCQMNRNVEQGKREPQLSDLRESGSIEQDADVVMFLYADPDAESDENDSMRRIILKLAKNRHGAQGKIPLLFNTPVLKFSEIRESATRDGNHGHWQDGQ